VDLLYNKSHKWRLNFNGVKPTDELALVVEGFEHSLRINGRIEQQSLIALSRLFRLYATDIAHDCYSHVPKDISTKIRCKVHVNDEAYR